MNPSSNLFIIGPTGAGKTALGKKLAAHYQLQFMDLDHAIVEHTGADIPTIFDLEGEQGFRKRERTILSELCKTSGIVLATGAGAVLDKANREQLSGHGFVMWLDISIEQQLERLAHKTNRPLLEGVNRRQKFSHMASIRTPIYRQLAELRVATSHEPLAHTLKHVINTLDLHWQRL